MGTQNRIGETGLNSYGSLMTIVEYKNARDITVEFENGYKVNSRYIHFKNGNIKSLYDKTICNIGYIGEGEYLTTIKINKKDKPTLYYQTWNNMIRRCYDKKELEKHPTYKDCEVCQEWLCFQTFARWFDENYYECENEVMCLDKDILYKGNKIYSPKTCVFVPQRINSLFTKSDASRGDLPIGVRYRTDMYKYQARCNTLEKPIHIGTFNTCHQAFYDGYKPFKEQYIKQVAEEYKSKIPLNLYNAMYKWEVNIND